MEQNQQVNFKEDLEALQRTRDELRLKLHLAKADARDEFHRLEKKWERIEEDLRRTASHTKEPLQTIGEKTRELMTELKQTYARIKPTFTGENDPS